MLPVLLKQISHCPSNHTMSLHQNAFLQKALLNHLRLPQQWGSRRWSSQVSLQESETRSTYIFTARGVRPLPWIYVLHILFLHEISGSQIQPVDHQRPPGPKWWSTDSILHLHPTPFTTLQQCPPHALQASSPAFQSHGKITTCTANTGSTQPLAATNSWQPQGPEARDHKRGEERGLGSLEEGAGTKERERRTEERKIGVVQGSWGQWSTKNKPVIKYPMLRKTLRTTALKLVVQQELWNILNSTWDTLLALNTVVKNHPTKTSSSNNKNNLRI